MLDIIRVEDNKEIGTLLRDFLQNQRNGIEERKENIDYVLIP